MYNIEEVNKLLSEGMTVGEVEKQLGFGTDVLRKKLGKNYKYDRKLKKYTPKEQGPDVQRKISEPLQEQTHDIQVADTFMLELQNEKLQNNLLALAKQYDQIQEALVIIKSLDSLKADTKQEVITVIQEGIKIDLPEYEGAAYRASIRINPIVWSEFDAFAAKHSEFDKASLIAMAMKEYIEKHKGH